MILSDLQGNSLWLAWLKLSYKIRICRTLSHENSTSCKQERSQASGDLIQNMHCKPQEMTHQYVRNRPLNVRLAAKIKICSVSWFRIDSMHCISYPLKRKEGKTLLFKQTLRSRFMSLACQHFSFHTKKLLGHERSFSLAFADRLSFFVPLMSRALSHTCGHLCVPRVLLNRLHVRKKRLLVV